jgi:hypothetical protein
MSVPASSRCVAKLWRKHVRRERALETCVRARHLQRLSDRIGREWAIGALSNKEVRARRALLTPVVPRRVALAVWHVDDAARRIDVAHLERTRLADARPCAVHHHRNESVLRRTKRRQEGSDLIGRGREHPRERQPAAADYSPSITRPSCNRSAACARPQDSSGGRTRAPWWPVAPDRRAVVSASADPALRHPSAPGSPDERGDPSCAWGEDGLLAARPLPAIGLRKAAVQSRPDAAAVPEPEVRLGGSGECYLMPTTIESGPTRCSTRVVANPASFIQPEQSAAV